MTAMFRDGSTDVTWSCHICKQERPDSAISVRTKPMRGVDGTPSRIISENVRYCNDNPVCMQASRTYSFLRNWK